MHVLTSIYETLDSIVVINQHLSYFIVNDITTSTSCRIQRCDQPILNATNLSKYLHGNPTYDFLDTDYIPKNTMILIKECFCGWKCNMKRQFTAMVSVNGKSREVTIYECSKCSK